MIRYYLPCACNMCAICLYMCISTPIQNNLSELWALLSLVTFGRFNSKTDFKSHFEQPIKKSMKRSAHRDAVELGERRQAELQHLVRSACLSSITLTDTPPCINH